MSSYHAASSSQLPYLPSYKLKIGLLDKKKQQLQTPQIGNFGRSGDRREWALEIPKIRRDREISHVCVSVYLHIRRKEERGIEVGRGEGYLADLGHAEHYKRFINVINEALNYA